MSASFLGEVADPRDGFAVRYSWNAGVFFERLFVLFLAD